MDPTGLRILMVSSEAFPFAKVGGLGDVVSALAGALDGLGHDVRLVLPRYSSIDLDGLERISGALGVPIAGIEEWCEVYQARLPGTEVPVYFLDHEELFDRDGIYGSRAIPSFEDNLARFTVLSRGAFRLCRVLDWIPDVMHAHDWPSALVPVYLKTIESGPPFDHTASMLTIHNLGYQGVFDRDDFSTLELPWEAYRGAGFEDHGRVNLLQAGLGSADVLTTVSPTYAREIQTARFGEGLEGLLHERSDDLFGVLNGIDYEVWSPAADPHIPAPFSVDDLSGKSQAKARLQEELGLAQHADVPVIGMVSRLVEQKGFGELCGPSHGSLYRMCDELAIQVAILGTGEAWCETELAGLETRLDNLRAVLDYNEGLAHLIEAGSDFFFMPSRYEPCGLNQMYSLSYGTLPIVRNTGGLADTVADYDRSTGAGTGFVFDELSPEALFGVVERAVRTWYDRPQDIAQMRLRAMRQRFSWEDSAARYAELYRRAIARRTGSE